jgi:hypothetical protein
MRSTHLGRMTHLNRSHLALEQVFLCVPFSFENKILEQLHFERPNYRIICIVAHQPRSL